MMSINYTNLQVLIGTFNMLPWSTQKPRAGTRLAYAQAEFFPLHPVLPCLKICWVDPAVIQYNIHYVKIRIIYNIQYVIFWVWLTFHNVIRWIPKWTVGTRSGVVFHHSSNSFIIQSTAKSFELNQSITTCTCLKKRKIYWVFYPVVFFLWFKTLSSLKSFKNHVSLYRYLSWILFCKLNSMCDMLRYLPISAYMLIKGFFNMYFVTIWGKNHNHDLTFTY